LYSSIGVAIRFALTGKRGSGLWFVGSIAATVGILVLPVETFFDRLTWCWVPVAGEGLVILIVYWMSRRKT
jgi:hypothetical protein